MYILRTYVPACVPATVWHTMSRQSLRGEAAGHAAKPRPCEPAACRGPRGEAASCRGKAARGEAAYNLVIIIYEVAL